MPFDISPPPAGRLYKLDDLMAGYDPADVESIIQTYTFRQFQAYCPLRNAAIQNKPKALKVAAHDTQISNSLLVFLRDLYGKNQASRPTGFMGKTSMPRSHAAYSDIAKLAREVARAGYLVVTGGGPGLMEAAHVGAHFADAPQNIFDAALKILSDSSAQTLPKKPLVDENGELIQPLDQAVISANHTWFSDALVARKLWNKPRPNLAVSTWEYGQEPIMPFATAYAAYFQNSIREASLVRQSRVGIIYGQGGGGTVREAFQDVEENYYCEMSSAITPMIFFDQGGYWDPAPPSPKPNGIPIYRFLVSLFENAYKDKPGVDWKSKLLNTTDHVTILNLLAQYESGSDKAVQIFLSGHKPAFPTNFV